MPDNNTLRTRIILKNDSLANWSGSSLVLKKGEMALVEVASSDKYSAPTYLAKVGDGVHTFDELNYMAAQASDVYSWAKAATKPTYSFEEIQGTPPAGATYRFAVTNDGETDKCKQLDIYETLPGQSEVLKASFDLSGYAWYAITATDIANWNNEIGAKAAAAAAQAAADAKVASVSAGDASIDVDGTATAPTVAVALSAEEGNILSLENDGLYVPTPAAATVTGVKEGEKIIGLDGTELTSTLTVAITDKTVGSATNPYIQLLGKSNQVVAEVDASRFVVDGMLQSATYDSDTHVITLTWNTDAGIQATDIDVSDLVDTYTAGDGLALANNEFSVDIASGEEYIEIDENGKLASAAKLASDIADAAAEGTAAADLAKRVNLVQDGTDGHKVIFTPAQGNAVEITIPDKDTTYMSSTTIQVSEPPAGETTGSLYLRYKDSTVGDANFAYGLQSGPDGLELKTKAFDTDLTAATLGSVPTSAAVKTYVDSTVANGYVAGNGISITNGTGSDAGKKVIALDVLTIDCGSATQVID